MPGSMRDAFKKAGVPVPSAKRAQHSRPGVGSGSRGRRARPPKLPASYFSADTAGHECLLTDFVSRDHLVPYVESFGNGKPSLTTGQLRRFFHHCREIERQLTVEGKSWERVSAKFASLSAHAHNAFKTKIPAEFRNFIDENVDRVLKSEDPKRAFLRGFLRHFEAIVGFSATHLGK